MTLDCQIPPRVYLIHFRSGYVGVLELLFKRLMTIGLSRGYFLKRIYSLPVVRRLNHEQWV